MPQTVRISAFNDTDKFVRILGLWVDKLPPKDWYATLAGQGTADIVGWIQSGGTLSGQLESLKDGEHSMYIAISQQAINGLGPWAGNLTIDGITREWQNVDFDTLGVFQFTVRDGKVIDSSKTGNEENTGDDSNMIGDRIKSLGKTISDHKEVSAAIALLAGVAGVGVWTWKKQKRF